MGSEPASRPVNLDLFAEVDRRAPRSSVDRAHSRSRRTDESAQTGGASSAADRSAGPTSGAPGAIPSPFADGSSPTPGRDHGKSAEPQPAPRSAEAAPAPSGPSFFGRPFREFEYSGGVHLADSVLWCDADRKRDLSFISSAHVDVMGKNRRILSTDETLKILTRGTGRIDALTSPYRRSFTLGPLELEMHPSGRMLGAAQLLVVRNGRRILYTNDFLTQRLATAERAHPRPVDVVALPATFGQPNLVFPPREEVFEDIRGFIDRSFEEKATPVLVVPPLGPAQELMYLLGKRGYRIRAHRSIFDVGKIYIQLGVNLLNAKRLQGAPARDEVVLVPPILRHSAPVRKIKNPRTAWIGGRAVDPGHVHRTRVDAAFPFGEAPDFHELVDFVEQCDPSEVYVTTGEAEALASRLAHRGRRVLPLVQPEQLALF